MRPPLVRVEEEEFEETESVICTSIVVGFLPVPNQCIMLEEVCQIFSLTFRSKSVRLFNLPLGRGKNREP